MVAADAACRPAADATDANTTRPRRAVGRAVHPNGEIRVIDSIDGHFADLGLHSPDNEFIDEALRDLLSRPA